MDIERFRVARVRAISSGHTRIHALLQLREIPTDDAKAELIAEGLDLGAYVGGRAWVASVPADRVDALIRRAGVRHAEPWDAEWKLHPRVVAGDFGDWTRDPAQPGWVMLFVQLHHDVPLTASSGVAATVGGVGSTPVEGLHGFTLWMPENRVGELGSLEDVLWIEEGPMPLSATNDGLRAQTRSDAVSAAPYNLTGAGVNIFVYDVGTVRATHETFSLPSSSTRVTLLDSTPSDVEGGHPTHVAGTAAGDGSGSTGGRGVAPGAAILSAGYERNLLDVLGVPLLDNVGDIEADYQRAVQNAADLGTNSIGSNIARNALRDCARVGDYGAASSLLDGIVRGDNAMVGRPVLMTWSNGNERNEGSTPGRCGANFRTITPPACAKNPIQVGAIHSDGGSMTNFSSWGPCDDGRLKPVVSAPGCETGWVSGEAVIFSALAGSDDAYGGMCGTSMATPGVAGIVALFMEGWHTWIHSSPLVRPSPALVKALLIHTARDLGPSGPDYMFGYGAVDAKDLIDTLRVGDDTLGGNSATNWGTDSVGQGQAREWTYSVPEGIGEFKASMAWDDVAAPAMTARALVNDLDLQLIAPGGAVYRAWTLDPANPQSPATTGTNDLDNQEQVRVSNPEPGNWTVRVVGTTVPQGPQAFALVYSTGQGYGNALTTTFDFEGGTHDFVLTGASRVAAPAPGHGSFSLRFGGATSTQHEATRNITIPANAARAELSYHWHMSTEEIATDANYDEFYVEIRNSSGAVVAVSDFRTDGWPRSFWMHQGGVDVTPWIGQPVRIAFRSWNNPANPTTFWIDDVTLTSWTAAPPIISDVGPPSAANTGSATLTITGANFLEHMTARLYRAGSERTATSVHVVGSSQIEATFDLAGAPIGPWSLEVRHHNNDGGQTATHAFTVTAEAASVALDGAAVNVSEGGSHLAYVRLSTANGLPLSSPVTVNYATGGDSATAGVDYTSISGQVTFAAGSPDGSLRNTPFITIVADGTAEPSESFTLSLSSPMGADLGAPSTQTVTILGTIGSPVQPTITSIEPSRVTNAGPVIITIRGTGYRPQMTSRLVKPTLSDINSTNVQLVGETELRATFDVTGVATTDWSVRVRHSASDGGREASLSNSLTIVAPPPTLSHVSPASAPNTGPVDVMIHGARFIGGMTARLQRIGESDIPSAPLSNVTATTAPARFDLAGATIGPWDVVVTHSPNDGGQSATLTNSFFVLAPAPSLLSANPQYASNARPVEVTIFGSNFRNGMAASLTANGAPAVTAGRVDLVSSNELKAVFDLTSAAPGVRDLVVIHHLNDGGQTAFLPAALTVGVAPSITTQPVDQTIGSGQATTTSVVANGAPPLAYQWYQGTSGDTADPISAGTGSSYTTPALTASTAYWVRVFNLYGSADSNTAAITVTTPNDTCADAVSITSIPYQNTQSAVSLTTDPGDPTPLCGNGSRARSAWYRYTAPVSGRVTADTVGSDYDTILSAYTGSCGSLSPVANGCEDNRPPTLQSQVTIPVTMGATYYFMVSSFSGSGGTLVFHLEASDLIFKDGFESGHLSLWPVAQTDGGDLTVSTAAAMASTAFGIECLVDDRAPLYVRHDSADERRYRARFYFDPNGFDPGEASGRLRQLIFFALSEEPLQRLASVMVRRRQGQYAIGVHVRKDDDTRVKAPFSDISDDPHVIEIDWRAATAPGANDGSFEMWIDGVSVVSYSDLDNDERLVDFVRLGALSVKPGAAGTLLFDEFEARRETYIGP